MREGGRVTEDIKTTDESRCVTKMVNPYKQEKLGQGEVDSMREMPKIHCIKI